MELLLYLSGRPGQTVSKQELMERVWRAHVVDEAVHRAVSLLRSALGDSATSPAIIETVPRHGYRLLIRPTATGHRRLLLGAAMIGLALAGIALFQASISPRGAATTDFESVPPLAKGEPIGRPAGTVPNDDPPRSAARIQRPAWTAATAPPVPAAVSKPMVETPAAAPLAPTPQPSAIGSVAAQQPPPIAPVAAEHSPVAAKPR